MLVALACCLGLLATVSRASAADLDSADNQKSEIRNQK
jgi:hypothetical protein